MAPGMLDSLDDDLKPMVLRIVEQNASLLVRLDELLAQNATLLARVAELEAKLGQPPKTPANSSLPPAKGQKSNAPEQPARKKTRKGRPGVARQLCPDPDRTRDIFADACGCGATLPPAGQELAHAYDHLDLPPIKPITTRINLHRCLCPVCKKRVTATPPSDMAPGSPFGPGIVALVTYLHATQMVSYSRLTEVLGGVFGLTLSEGAIANMLSRAAKPFAARGAEIAAIVRASPVIASDETSARVCKQTYWQWAFAAKTAVYHMIAATRGKIVPTEFLAGAKPDVWMSDRLAAQATHAVAHQVCLAHLIRDAQFAIDAGDSIFAPAFLAFLKKACGIGRRRPQLSDATIKTYARDLTRELDRLLALEPTQKDGCHLRASMAVGARDKLLVFMTRRDVEPTNISARALRPSVIFRKVTNCFRSLWGAKIYADICSIVATGRLTGRSPLDAIRDALAAVPKAAAT
jgi:transposase